MLTSTNIDSLPKFNGLKNQQSEPNQKVVGAHRKKIRIHLCGWYIFGKIESLHGLFIMHNCNFLLSATYYMMDNFQYFFSIFRTVIACLYASQEEKIHYLYCTFYINIRYELGYDRKKILNWALLLSIHSLQLIILDL